MRWPAPPPRWRSARRTATGPSRAHATVAGASAATLVPVRRTLVRLTVPLALLAAFSRVFVGVHYPHDVAAGLLLGVAVTLTVVALATRPATRVAGAVRGSAAPLARWLTGPGPRPAADRPHAPQLRN